MIRSTRSLPLNSVNFILKMGICALCLSSCNSESSFDCNGKLKDKDVRTIKACTVGMWEMTGSTGGFTGQGTDVTDRQVKFTKDDSIYYVVHGQRIVADKITWVHAKDVFNELTYLIEFHDTSGTPVLWGIDGIYSERLTIYENGYDGYTYYLKKQL